MEAQARIQRKTARYARLLASSQSKTEDKILCLDHKVQVLSEENKRFKEDIGKLRNYLKFFDLF